MREDVFDMAILVSTIGMSPAVVTEAVDELERRGVKVEQVTVLPTRAAEVSCDVLAVDFKHGPYQGGKKLQRAPLPFDDIINATDCQTFRNVLRRELRTALRKAGSPEEVYVSLAGGRKTMPVDAMLVAIASGVQNIYHIIAEEIPGVGSIQQSFSTQELDQIRRHAKDGTRPSEDALKKIVNLCHPRGLTIHLVRIPTPRLTEPQRTELAQQLF